MIAVALARSMLGQAGAGDGGIDVVGVWIVRRMVEFGSVVVIGHLAVLDG